MTWIGEYPEDFTTVTCMFTTQSASGAPVAPSTAFEAADIIIFKNGSATEKTTTNGVTMTSPFNGTTGLHCVVIDTSNDTGDGGFWVSGAVYTLVLVPDETVDSVAVAKVVGQFGLELAEVLRPTTAGRQLDVSAGGEAGIDWANIGSPTTAVNLSATNIDVDQVVASVSGAVGSVSGLTASDVGAIKTKTDFLPSATAGAAGGVFIAGTNAATTVTTSFTTTFTGNLTGSVASVTGNVAGNVTGSVGSIASGGIAAASFAAGAINAAAIATGAIDADAIAADAGTEIGTAVWATATRSLTILDEDSTTLDLDATIRSAVGLASANLDTQLDVLPTAAENADAVWDEALSGHTTGDTFGDVVNDLTEDDGGVYRFTTNALEQAPTGGAAPTVGQIADEVQTRTIAAVTIVNGLAANTLTAAALATDAVTEIQSGLATAANLATLQTSVNTIDDLLDTEIPALTTAVADLPTNAELATALGTADDAVLAALAIVDGNVDDIETMVSDIWQIHGLDIANPMTVTPTSRDAGTIEQTISGNGTTTSTVTRTV